MTLSDPLSPVDARLVHLVTGLVQGTLAAADWTHEAHLAVGTWHVAHLGREAALDRLQQLIPRLNLALGNVNDDHHGYHETITVAFMRLVHDALRHTGPFVTSAAFCARHPELLEKSVLSRFYTKDRLRSPEAKREFVEPDLAPLPEATMAQRISRAKQRIKESGAPDLAVEIVSPSENALDLHAKIQLYLENGAKAVWIIWPESRQIDIHQRNQPTRHLDDTCVIEGEAPVPSFRLPVAALFE